MFSRCASVNTYRARCVELFQEKRLLFRGEIPQRDIINIFDEMWVFFPIAGVVFLMICCNLRPPLPQSVSYFLC